VHFGLADPERDRPVPLESASIDTPSDVCAMVLELIGERKRVLDIGCGPGTLAGLLAARQCDIVGIDRDPLCVEEARRFCTHAFVADVDNSPIAQIADNRTFDAIVLGDVLGHLREPLRVLDECRGLLGDGGFLVASVANATHGSIRLALYSGAFSDPFERARTRFYSAKGVEELFLHAGFRIDRLERASAPVNRENAPAEALAEIAADPESETLSFVIRAMPLSNEAKYREISKRLFLVSGELAAATQTIAARDREIEKLLAERTTANGARRSQLVEGLRLALEQAIAMHDVVVADAAALQRQLDGMTANRDAHVTFGADAVRQRNELKTQFAALQQERDDIANRGGEIARDLERAEAELQQARAEHDRTRADYELALAESGQIEALEAQLDSFAQRVTTLQERALEIEAEGTERESELRLARDAAEALTLRLAEQKTALASEKNLRAERDAQIGDMRRILAKLESEVIDAWSEIERLEGERDAILVALAEAGERYETARERNKQFEKTAHERAARAAAREAELFDECETLRALDVEHDYQIKHLKVLLAERAREASVVAEELEVAQSRLIVQADALSEATEAECRSLASLIDTVQSGPYWSLKRISDRLRSAFRG
jgi:SAM-dependent methyltransferase